MRDQLILLFLVFNCLAVAFAAQQLTLTEKNLDDLYDLSEKVQHSNEDDRCARYEARIREMTTNETLKKKPGYVLLGKVINFLKANQESHELKQQVVGDLIKCNQVFHKTRRVAGSVPKRPVGVSRKAGPKVGGSTSGKVVRTTTSQPELPQDALIDPHNVLTFSLTSENVSELSKINYEAKRDHLDEAAVCQRYTAALRGMFPEMTSELDMLRQAGESMIQRKLPGNTGALVEELAKCEMAASGESNSEQQETRDRFAENRIESNSQNQEGGRVDSRVSDNQSNVHPKQPSGNNHNNNNNYNSNTNSNTESDSNNHNNGNQRNVVAETGPMVHQQNGNEVYAHSHQTSESLNNGNGPVVVSSASVSTSTDGKHSTITTMSDGRKVVTTTSDGKTVTTNEDNNNNNNNYNNNHNNNNNNYDDNRTPEPSHAEERDHDHHDDDHHDHHDHDDHHDDDHDRKKKIEKLEAEVEEVEKKNRHLLEELEENQEKVEQIKRKLAALKPAAKQPASNQYNGQLSGGAVASAAGNVFASAGSLPNGGVTVSNTFGQPQNGNYQWSWSSNSNNANSNNLNNIPAFPKIEFPAFPEMPTMPPMPPMPTMFPRF